MTLIMLGSALGSALGGPMGRSIGNDFGGGSSPLSSLIEGVIGGVTGGLASCSERRVDETHVFVPNVVATTSHPRGFHPPYTAGRPSPSSKAE